MTRVHSHNVATKFHNEINDRRFNPHIFATAITQEDKITNQTFMEIIEWYLYNLSNYAISGLSHASGLQTEALVMYRALRELREDGYLEDTLDLTEYQTE